MTDDLNDWKESGLSRGDVKAPEKEIASLKAQLTAANNECRAFKVALQEVSRRSVKLPQRYDIYPREDENNIIKKNIGGEWMEAEDVLAMLRDAGIEIEP